MIIHSRLFKKPISLFENKNSCSLLALAPATFTPPKPTINFDPITEPITSVVDGVKTVGEVGLKGLELLGKLAEYIANPITLLTDLWNCIHSISYPVLLALAMFSLFMYFAGHKNFAKYIPSSLIVFTFIQAIGRF